MTASPAMSTSLAAAPEQLHQIDLELLVAAATAEVAPVWPLDRAIAVNPWWQQRDRHIEEIAAEQQAWFNIPMLHGTETTERGLPFLRGSVAAVKGWRLRETASRSLPWLTEIQQQMSQFCALWVSYPEQVAQDENLGERMYKQWLNVTRHDRGIELLLNNKKVKQQLKALPCDYRELYRQAQALPLDDAQWPVYLQVLLHELYGWASVFAQRRWQRDLEQQPRFNDELNQLLAIRLAWDLVCWHSVSDATRAEFQVQWASFERLKSQVREQQQPMWQALRAKEQAYQQQLAEQLCGAAAVQNRNGSKDLQAVFCIDVRSEPMRRALEAQSSAIQTFGFAGFFGLPIEYQISQGYSKPQLPGLLAPQWQVSQACDAQSQQNLRNTWRSASWHRAHESPAGAYGWVEMSGITKAWKLLKKSLTHQPLQRVASGAMNEQPWRITKNGAPATASELAQLAANALTGIGLKQDFARQVLIVGHSASTQNNPHAASLECGACGGQSGAANAQVLAQMLNDKEVREQLAAQHNIHIPETTEFLAALHDTTQQTVSLLTSQKPKKLCEWLDSANQLAQQEQLIRLNAQPAPTAANAPKKGSPFWGADSAKVGCPSFVSDALQRRAGSWAEVRPEWGLARNAAIIFAPRERTRSCNFDARVFLHDYDHGKDPSQQVLTQLMTAPMVVAHWINMQYYASTVAPKQFGSGNKLLHNVVADGLGVFEGNGGDIRIGLARQSIHDGKDWYHEPLRLTVVIAAEQAAIDKVISEQPMVQQLIDNEWLHLWQWHPEQPEQPEHPGQLTQRKANGWQPVAHKQPQEVSA